MELLWERRFNPNWPLQPRVPRQNPGGGQWTDGGRVGQTGVSADTEPRPREPRTNLPLIRVSDEIGNPLGKPPKIPLRRPRDSVVRNGIIRGAAKWLKAFGRAGGTLGLVLDYFEETWLRNDLNEIEAYLDDPKSLEDLQRDVAFPKKGYHIHHIVEQGPARDDGDPEEKINAPDNLVRIPALIHREITAWYNTKSDDFGGMSPRNYLRGKSWEERRRVGLDKLIEFGVLKP